MHISDAQFYYVQARRKIILLRVKGIHFIHFLFVCLFELIFDVPFNSNGHVGTLPPFYGTFTQHYDVMTLKMRFINITTQLSQ